MKRIEACCARSGGSLATVVNREFIGTHHVRFSSSGVRIAEMAWRAENAGVHLEFVVASRRLLA